MSERDELLKLIKCAIEFCNLAAGEGITIDNLSPEDFLFDYSDATGYEDWCTISDYVIDQIMRDGREIERLREVLTWYGEQARLARLIHREGDDGRIALSADGGGRARAALSGEAEK